jgi:hypothetical protein
MKITNHSRWNTRRRNEQDRQALGILDQKEWMLYKARLWNEKYGDPPSAYDWNVAQARRVAHPERMAQIEERQAEEVWPSTSSILKHFGRWNAFIEEAGLEPMPPSDKRFPEIARQHMMKSSHA